MTAVTGATPGPLNGVPTVNIPENPRLAPSSGSRLSAVLGERVTQRLAPGK